MAAILKPISDHISASIALSIMILVSKYMFLGSRNSIMAFSLLSNDWVAAILDIQDGRHSKPISDHISASIALSIMILVSKYMFWGARDSFMAFSLLSNDWVAAILDIQDGRHSKTYQ